MGHGKTWSNISKHRNASNSISFSHLICQHLAQATAFFVDLCIFPALESGGQLQQTQAFWWEHSLELLLSLAAIGFTRRLWNRGSYAAVSPKTWNLQTWNPHGQTYGIQHIRTRIKCVRRIAQWLLRHEENVLRKGRLRHRHGASEVSRKPTVQKIPELPEAQFPCEFFSQAVSVLKHFVLLMVRTCSNIYIYYIYIGECLGLFVCGGQKNYFLNKPNL